MSVAIISSLGEKSICDYPSHTHQIFNCSLKSKTFQRCFAYISPDQVTKYGKIALSRK